MRNKKLVNYAKYGYFFSIPFILTFCVFTLYPVIYTFVIGFTDLKGAGNTDWHFLPTVGKNLFANFKDVLTSGTFQKAFKNTWIIWIMNFIPQIGFALLFTAWFTDRRSKVKGQGIFKILFYMPNIITAATLAILFNVMFGYPKGPANDILIGVVHNLNDLAISHEVIVLDELLLDVDLLESLSVHEVCTEVILVSELVRTTLNAYLLDLDTYRREGILENATVLQVLELRTNKCRTLAWLAVLEIDNNKSLAIHLDTHTDFDISCCNCHSCIFLCIRNFRVQKYKKLYKLTNNSSIAST